MCRIAASIVLVLVMVAPTSFALGGDNVGINHVTTTYSGIRDIASCRRVAEMVCCHCYSTKSDGTRFYHGILEAGFCRSQRGYCEGYAKCFQ